MGTQDDDDEIDFSLDDLNWPPMAGSSGSASGWPAGGINIPVGAGSIGGLGGAGLGGAGISINGGLNSQMTAAVLLTPTVKNNVKYVIVPEDGSPCLELEEQKTITPREMIGISKFINMVNNMISADFVLFVNWTSLIKNLGIERHFVQGLPNMPSYDQDNDTLYLFLFDD